ncbi:MAG: aminotransferase class I/II-fold pyridoxal phosphate-dependent enzyme, partial [Clostridia bacterium]|nr:aminotransferase class I/II-fold pyridoxal phosphate-dependent enzyme [Clostridia bacterium]
FFEKGSRVVVQPPVYGPFFSVPKKAGMEVIENPLIRDENGWRMDFDGLEALLKKGADALVLCSPHNPVGRIWTGDELRRLCSLCNRYAVTLISDEIHSDFELEGRHTCLLSLEAADRAVQLVSATKTFNLAALRHSAILCRNAELREKIRAQLDRAMADVNLYGRLATRLAYENGDDWLDTLLVYLRENRDTMATALRATGLLQPTHVQGTYLMWVDCRALKLGNKELMDFFIKKAGIIPSEGGFFGAQGEGFIRLNLATQRSRILEAADKIAAALKTL